MLYIYGCGGHARSAADLYLMQYPDADLIFIDPAGRKGEQILGFPVLTSRGKGPCFFAIGDNRRRQELCEQWGMEEVISIVSPRAYLGRECQIGRGVLVGNFCHIGPQASIGVNTIINNGAIVEHEVRVGAYCHIAPRVAISGRSRIGDRVFIGVGAVVREGVEIGSDIVVGAGAVVVGSLLESGVYVGCPARLVKMGIYA